MKVLSVVGNRPQFVKSAPLSVALRGAGIDEVVLHTGQHYDPQLSLVFFQELGLHEPDFALELHTADTDAMRPGIEQAIAGRTAEWVLVYGDTNSTLAGAQAAERTGVPIAHVEAGLRSGDRSMPEERNRIEVDRVSALLFCPDEDARGTLERERVRGRTEVVGDVMADAAARFAPIARERSRILTELGLEPGGYVVVTIHREANVFPPRLGRIVAGLNRIEEPVAFPAHPRTRAQLDAQQLELAAHVRLLPPAGYLDFAALASQARVIVTDSGGLQKEAYWYGVPCVTASSTTEWTATLETGGNVLVDDDPEALEEAVRTATMPLERPTLYGDGRASERIADVLRSLSPND